MAAILQFADSFDHYALVQINGKWTAVGMPGPSLVVGRTDMALNLVSQGFTTLPGGARDNLTMGAFRRSNTMGDTQGQLIIGSNGSFANATARFEADGRISAYNKLGTKVGTSTNVVYELSVGHYIELGVSCSETLGQIIVRVDGEEVINVSGTNTGATTQSFGVAGTGGGTFTNYDDLYVSWDNASAISFMSDVEVRAIFPDGAGALTDWTGVSGANYTNVDEDPPDVADYNKSAVVGNVDTFTFPDLTFTGTVWGVQFCAYAKKDDTEIRAIQGVCRIGGVNYLSTNTEYLSTDIMYYRFVWGLNPATTAAWTVAQVNAAEFGYRMAI